MRTTRLLSVLLLLFAFRASATSVPVKGRVVDASGASISKAAIKFWRVGSAETAGAAMSDATGSFAVDLEPAEYVLVVAVNGVDQSSDTIVVSNDRSDLKDIRLAALSLNESITVNGARRYVSGSISSATKTDTPLREVPQAVTVVTHEQMQDQMMSSIGDVVRYVPGVTLHQGENNRDQIIMRGNSSSADFFVNGVRDDVQYYRDLYNLERVDVLKGPNALIFGRGGAGGVVNRVAKEAGFSPLREVTLDAGAFEQKRASIDVNQPLSKSLAFRLNAVHEDSGSFREAVSLRRSGIAPSITFMPADNTVITAGFEHFNDGRVADRGISSFRGRPANVDIETYYGNPDDSHVHADVNLGWTAIEHRSGSLTIRNRTMFGAYDRFYQNYVPGAVSADQSRVALSAYNNATNRENIFNQFDASTTKRTGSIEHKLLFGVEAGRQRTDNFRNTGFFNNTATSILVPYANPLTATPVTFRQSATDADNRVRTSTISLLAQDQLSISERVKFVAGARVERFNIDYRNNRNGDRLEREDTMVSPRAGVIFNLSPALSAYGSYSTSFLPGSGDQFSSLTSITQQLEPERLDNYETGVKWDAPRGLSLTTAVYRLDRTNTRSTDPNDPTRIVQTGSQRATGVELSVSGNITPSWSVAGGYAYQDAYVTSATAAARQGARVAQVPHNTLSLWNDYRVSARFGAALGFVYRTAMFAAIDNTVVLPGYTEVDSSAYVNVAPSVRLQVNVENIFDTKYYRNADNNTNISPGSPRTFRVAMITRF